MYSSRTKRARPRPVEPGPSPSPSPSPPLILTRTLTLTLTPTPTPTLALSLSLPQAYPGEAALGHGSSDAAPILGWQVVPYSPTEDLPVQMFASSSHLPPLPPPSKRLRVSLMDAACASRGELEMHHIPFFFKVRARVGIRLRLRLRLRLRVRVRVRVRVSPHHIPFSFKGGPNGNAAHQAAALFVEQPS